MSAKKVKVKVKKRKLKIKNIFITLIILTLFALVIIDITKLPVKNIYIKGNNILTDKTIIDLADLEKYPPYINTIFTNIRKKLLKNDYIKSVSIKRTLSRKIYLVFILHLLLTLRLCFFRASLYYNFNPVLQVQSKYRQDFRDI